MSAASNLELYSDSGSGESLTGATKNFLQVAWNKIKHPLAFLGLGAIAYQANTFLGDAAKTIGSHVPQIGQVEHTIRSWVPDGVDKFFTENPALQTAIGAALAIAAGTMALRFYANRTGKKGGH